MALVYALSHGPACLSVPPLLMETHTSPLPSGLGHLCHRFQLAAISDHHVTASKVGENQVARLTVSSHALGASCGLLLPAEKWLLKSLEPAMGLYRRPNT